MKTFISHSWEYKLEAHEVAAALKKMVGIEVWYDAHSLHAGSDINDTILAELKDTELFILLWSAPAARSTGVHTEVRRALELNVPILPCRLDDTLIDPYFPALAGLKSIDLRQTPTGLNILRSTVAIWLLKEFHLDRQADFAVLQEWAGANEILGYALNRKRGQHERRFWMEELNTITTMIEEKLKPALAEMEEISGLMKAAIERIETADYAQKEIETVLTTLKNHPLAKDPALDMFIGKTEALRREAG